MTNHLAALASQVADLPFVHAMSHAIGEPSALAVLLTACGALVAGRLIGIRPATPSED
mgnify:FL=1